MHCKAEPQNPLCVLMVDDNVDLLRAAVALARSAGITVFEATSAKEAFHHLELQREIRILFTDIAMPIMDGIALAGEATRRFPELHVVLTSGLPPPPSSIPSQWRFLPKPYRLKDMIQSFKR